MTKKDYKIIADAINVVWKIRSLSSIPRYTIEILTASISGALKAENERFNIDAFKAACFKEDSKNDNI